MLQLQLRRLLLRLLRRLPLLQPLLLQRLRLRLRLGWVGWSEAVQELGAVVIIASIAAAVLVLSKVMRPVLAPPGPTRRNDPTATAPYTSTATSTATTAAAAATAAACAVAP